MGKKKRLSFVKWGVPIFLSTFCLMNEAPSMIVEAAKGASHIGTFNGSTTFTTSSSNGINPGLFIEVMDDYGRLTQYESKDGVITIPDTKEGAYVTQAKLLGKTKYKDIDSGEILDTWEEGRNLELVSVENPELKTVGKNLIDDSGIDSYPLTTEKTYSVRLPLNKKNFDTSKKYIVTGYLDTGEKMSTTYFAFRFINGTKTKHLKAVNFNSNFTLTENELEESVYFDVYTNGNHPLGSCIIKQLQLEENSVATSYEPYKENIITFNEDIVLRGIGDVRDELDLMTGQVTNRVGELVLDGSNDGNLYYTGTDSTDNGALRFSVHLPDKKYYSGNNNAISDKYRTVKFSDLWNGAEDICLASWGSGAYVNIRDTRYTTLSSFKGMLQSNPTTIQYEVAEESVKIIGLTNTYTFPPVKGQSMAVNGTVSTTIGSITIPTEALSFTLNPNLEEGQQFVAPEFSVSNDSHAPITLGVKSFEQVTDVLNDVLPDKYDSWEGLNKTESKEIALALVPQSSDHWLDLNEKPYYVATTTDETIGRIRGNSSVKFDFEALHGQAFDETINPQYQLTFVFEF